MTLKFVNYLGDDLPPPASSVPSVRTRRDPPPSYHKGFRVVGIPPGRVEEAEVEHNVAQNELVAKGSPFKPFDREHWIMNASKKSVRAKPYEVRSAAEVCADLAKKAGWLGVEVREMKKEEKK